MNDENRKRLLSKTPEDDNSAPVVFVGDNSGNAAEKRELSNPIKSYQIDSIGNGAAMRERESLIREDVDDNYHPNGWRVYVIEDKVFGFFAGFTNKGSPADVPMFCATLDGALKYDAFRDLAARERAVAVRNHYVPNAKVFAYKRYEIFPEQYGKQERR